MLRTAEEAREISESREVFEGLKDIMLGGVNIVIEERAKQGWYHAIYDYKRYESARSYNFEHAICVAVAFEIKNMLNELGYTASVSNSNLKIRWNEKEA